ncbi:MAG: hypothetical protein Kow00120_29840 [Anaerolineae bacterium]
MGEARIVSVVVQRPDGRVLIVQRSPRRRAMPGKWSVISGYIEEGESVSQAATREVREEIALEVVVEQMGAPFPVQVGEETLLIHPVLARAPADAAVTLDWENQAYRWIAPEEVFDYPRVPGLEDDFIAVGLLPGSPHP